MTDYEDAGKVAQELVRALAVAKSDYKAIRAFRKECMDSEVRHMAEIFERIAKTAYFEADCELSTHLRKMYKMRYS